MVWASQAWLQLHEFTTAQVLGHTLSLVHGPLTDPVSSNTLMTAIRAGKPIALSMVNHTCSGKAFRHTLRVEPLRDSRGAIQCFQATSSDIEFIPSGGDSSVGASSSYADDISDSSRGARISWGEGVRQYSGNSCGKEDVRDSMRRVGSDLKISEMLDLLGGSGSAPPSCKLGPTISEGNIEDSLLNHDGEEAGKPALEKDSQVVGAFFNLN